ncbi:tRNA (cytidine(34)-2'-O)-methyltransferase [Parasphingorhabdus pacifica]
MFNVVFHHPEIPGNTGNAIRMVAGAGSGLHLIEPLGFSVEDSKLRRAGLDYHDLAALHVHTDLNAAWDRIAPRRVIAFTAAADLSYAEIDYQPGDTLLFGRESTGLPDDVLQSPEITTRVRIPLLPGVRSLNLANSAAIAVYEAWRQQDFAMP